MWFSCVYFIFLQTDTTELKPVFGSFICKIESVFIEDKKGQFQMQKDTVIQGPKEHILLSYHLVLPYLPGSPHIPVPAWVGCTHGYGANLYLYSMCCSSNEDGESLSLCNNQFHMW